jgi:hypothetical protein
MFGGGKPKASGDKTSRSGRAECYAVGPCAPRRARPRRPPRATVAAAARAAARRPPARALPLIPAPAPARARAQARDAFYQCVRECGQLPAPGAPVPAKCRALRAAFEGACLPSWVRGRARGGVRGSAGKTDTAAAYRPQRPPPPCRFPPSRLASRPPWAGEAL